jgi:ABC-type tungstate transport system substrate-binding protein
MSGMVEKRGIGTWFTHAGLIAGVAIICFPIWIAFVASTVTQDDLRVRRCRCCRGRISSTTISRL